MHIAPSYGEDDFHLAKLNNIKIKDIVHDNGVYKENTPCLQECTYSKQK